MTAETSFSAEKYIDTTPNVRVMTIGLSSSSFLAEDITPSTSMVVDNYFRENGQLGLHNEQSNGNVRSVKDYSTVDSYEGSSVGNLSLESWSSPGQWTMGSALTSEESTLEGKFYQLPDGKRNDRN